MVLLAVTGVGCQRQGAVDLKTTVELDRGWEFRQVGGDQWYAAEVPGCVHTDLLRNRLIPDPFYRDNEPRVRWIETSDWQYRSRFDVPPEVFGKDHIELLFEGLDTYATVVLNGHEILDADNMFRTWRVDVGPLLTEAGNVIEVRFRSPVEHDLPRVGERGYELMTVFDGPKTSPYTRKAPYHYGWDWGPRFVTSGIWRPVVLEGWDDVRLTDVQVVQREVSGEIARLTLNVELEADGDHAVDLTVEDSTGAFRPRTVGVDLHAGVNVAAVDVEIRNPRLWWPNGLGGQPLYEFHARISVGGIAVDEMSVRTGLRSVELVRTEEEGGESFQFVVNGIPVFAKGANWIPADSFVTRVDRGRYRELLQSAVDANMNMLRVWGGGIYESADFYELCDELGIMVWQDFMFACNLYPGDEGFVASVRREAIDNVRRLRNHPSIVLWCGNNEVESAWREWGNDAKFPEEVWQHYLSIFHELLPEVVAAYDPGRAYWPSSASSNLQALPNSNDYGDIHHWGVWHGRWPFERYREAMPRFVSEYGFQSFPELATIERFALPEDYDVHSPVMEAHQKNAQGNEIIREYMLREFPEPGDFETFLYLSQVVQAQGIGIGTEHFRRIMPRCMGALYWQLNDCWPVASWASLDYFGRWKALHYYARRFFSKILLSPIEEEGQLRFYIVSDDPASVEAELRTRLLDFDGNHLYANATGVTVAPLASRVYGTMQRARLLGDADVGRVLLHSTLTSGDRMLSSDVHLFVPYRELELPDPAIEFRVTPADGAARITLQSERFAKDVALSIAGIDGFFSDNFFDLLPGEEIVIVFRPDEKIDIEVVRERLQVRSLADAMRD
jgi:beta-mannosidase